MISLFHKKLVVIYILLILTYSFNITASSKISNETFFETVDITVNQNGDIIEITYEINDYTEKTINIHDTEYKIITIGKESNLLQKGQPDLPNICRSIIIPDNTKMKIEIKNTQYQEIKNTQIAPSKGNLLRNTNPETIPYKFSETYQKDTYYPEKIATLREPYILRDYRAQVIEINPIQYNPLQKTIRIYNQIQIKITPDGTDDKNILIRTQTPNKFDTDFNQIYKKHFINYPNNKRYDPIEEQGNMLIITYDEFRDNLQAFVEWKLLKGIPTEIVNVSTIGDADDIKMFIKDYYLDYGLTYVLLVGDAEQVPTNILGGGVASDSTYTYIVGNDHYPDLFLGRFSAQNTEQLQTMIERSIEYEKYPQIEAEWYNQSTGIASNDNRIGDDGEYDWEHMRNIRSKLINYSFYLVDEMYDGSKGGEDEPGDTTSGMVVDAINDGRSIINYCGHGNPAKWTSSGFNTADIKNLVNDNKLPFVISVACNNGQFSDFDECFCEAWIRATNDETGEPTGAIAITGSSKEMTWAPPMDAQDEFIDLIVETYEENIKHTIGGIHYNGCIHMNDEYGYNGYTETDAWIVFGDPSLMLRTKSPEDMDIIHEPEIVEGASSFDITVSDTKEALCALSRDGNLLGYAHTDSNGNATLIFEPISGEEPSIDLVVTAYNKNPYITELPVDVNKAPKRPSKPEGPDEAEEYDECTFSSTSVDPDGDMIAYLFDWGDGSNSSWTEYYNSGETGEATHHYPNRGYYSVRVKTRDIYKIESEWSEEKNISISNLPPFKPSISGPKYFLNSGIEYEYIFKARDIEGDEVFIKVTWDQEKTDWIGPISSGESIKLKISWENPNTDYKLKAIAKDIFGEQSPWTTLDISTPRAKPSLNNMIEKFMQVLGFFRLLISYIFV